MAKRFISIELDPKVYARVETVASRSGVRVGTWVRMLIHREIVNVQQQPNNSPATGEPAGKAVTRAPEDKW